MFDLGEHVTTTESAIGAIAAVIIWILVIAYFCFCRRPISNRDIILREVLKAVAKETSREDKLAKIYISRSAPSLRNNHSLEIETRRTDYKKVGRWNQKLEPVWDERDIERWSEDVSSSISVGVLATRSFYATDVQLGLIIPDGLDEESSAIYVSSRNEEFNEKENESAQYKQSIPHHKCIDITKKRLQLTVL